MQIEVVTITPERAASILGANTNNRTVRKPVVDKYARDMAAGNWQENGASIVKNCDGTLLDGQHRLLACIKAGVPFRTVLVTGVDQAAMVNIDSGAGRNLRDVLKLSGLRNTGELASLTRLAIVWSLGLGNRNHAHPTNAECIAFIDRHPESHDAARIASNNNGVKIPKSAIGAFALNALCATGDTEMVGAFCDAVRKGSRDKSDPTYVLWRTFIGWSEQVNVTRQSMVYLALIVKAWNDTVLGNERQVYRWVRSGGSPERFPILLDANGDPVSLAV